MHRGHRWILFFAILAAVLATAGCSQTSPDAGERTDKVYHVGILCGLNFFADTEAGFREKMTELGYIEGKNIVYDSYTPDYNPAIFKSILDEFKAEKVDLIFAFPTVAACMAKEETAGTGIPVVFANSFTEDTGLIDSVRHPGGDITGVRWGGPDLALERYQVMRELSPGTERMFVPYQKGVVTVRSQTEALHRRAFADGLMIVEIPVDNATDLAGKLQEQAATLDSSTDAILMISEPLLVTPDGFEVVAAFAESHRLPLGGAYMAAGRYETLYGINPESVPQGRQAAVLADKILRGTPAGEIPVVTAENHFQLSYRAIQELGLPISQGLLHSADEIIR